VRDPYKDYSKHKPRFLEQLKHRARLLKREVIALYYAYRDPRTPWYARIFVALVVGYALSPIDLIPDFIPVLGYLDDLILVPLGISIALKLIPPEVMITSRQKADNPIHNQAIGQVFAFVIIFIWLLLAVLAILALWKTINVNH
jgi:uncharacterized membrane protein YkvA (DUF1232 family)